MKVKKLPVVFFAILLTISLSFSVSSVFAYHEQPNESEKELALKSQENNEYENLNANQVKNANLSSDSESGVAVKEENARIENKNSELSGVAEKNKNLEFAEEKVENALKAPEGVKVFTVTKRPVNEISAAETLVGEYDTFFDAIKACKQSEQDTQYIVTMNDNYEIPPEEGYHGKSNVNMILRSKEGNLFTLARTGEDKDIMALYNGAKLETENVILDGTESSEAFGVVGGTLTLGKGTVVQNFIDLPRFDGPAIYISSNGTLNIHDGAVIKNNQSNQAGGIIQALDDTTVNITGGTFVNNKSNKSDGGVIAAYGNLNVTGGVFNENNAVKVAGAIITGTRSNVTIKNAQFNNNKASTGGAVYLSNTSLISNTTFENNEAKWGGAVYARKAVEFKNAKFNENKASNQGGAIYLQGGDTEISESEFEKNTATSGGGAVFIAHNNNGTTSILKSTFIENQSTNFGGGIYVGGDSKLNLKDSIFSKNEAGYGGGISSAAIDTVDKSLTAMEFDNVIFKENTALMGGGVFTAYPTDIVNCSFEKNNAPVHPQDMLTNPHNSGSGGAIYVMDNMTVVKNSSFLENSAYGSGGAISVNGVVRDSNKNIIGKKKDIKLEISDNTSFKSNICNVGQGGAIYTIPYEYSNPITDKDAYKNLSIDKTTTFKENKSESGKFNPPVNFADFTNLQFSEDSDVLHGTLIRKSLLNNYDLNYKNPYIFVKFINGESIYKIVKADKGKSIENDDLTDESMPQNPTKSGYTFKEWNTQKDGKGTSFTGKTVVNEDMTVYAIYSMNAATMNEAPTLEVKDKTIKQGEALDLKSLVVSAKDKEDGDLIKAVKLIDDGGFNKDKVGKYTVTIKVTDKDGASVTKRAIVTVTYGLATMNEAPTLEVKDKTIKQGEALDLKSLVVSATDKEDGDLIKAVKLTDNGGFNKDKVGKYTVTFKVTDKDGASATKRAIVTVKYGLAAMNEAPTLEVKDKTIKQGEALDLKSLVVSAKDKEDGDLIKAVKLIDDGGFNKDKVGKYTVTFKVTDKDGASATKRATVTVIEKDKPLPNPEKNKPKHDNSKSKVQDDRISPKTGDSYNLSQYGMLLGLSGILLAAIEIRKRRKES